VEALAGKTIYVRRSSSYWTSLEALNERFLRQGRPPAILKPAPEELEDEDMLEMLNAGLLRIVIVGSHIAIFWKQFLPRIHLNPQAAVLTEGDIAWAVRKDSLRLRARLDAFIRKYGVNTTFGAVTFREYMKSGSVLRNAADPAELRKFDQLVAFFRRYGDQYSLDWMLMAAQGYQESRLNQNVRSAVGAIGVMQVMPDTGKALDVGDIRKTEPNIHAGVKYIRLLIDRNYSDAGIDDLNKGLFAFAAYNAGPATVASLRAEAARRHLDPNVWFNNVELVAAEKIGRQTVSYVRNIYKYYIAYKLVEEQVAETQRVTEELRKGRAR
jgi:membrane-bound lytic murein transglycosylase MltF